MLVPQRVNPVISPLSFSGKKKRLRTDGTLPWLHPDAELQVTVHYEAWSIGRLPWGVLGVFRLLLKVASKEFPGKSGRLKMNWLSVFFFEMVLSDIVFVFTPIWEK